MWVPESAPARHPSLDPVFILRLVHPICYSSPLQLAWLTSFVHSNPPPPPPATPTPLLLLPVLLFFLAALTSCSSFSLSEQKHNTVGGKQRRYLSMQIITTCFSLLPNFCFSSYFFTRVLCSSHLSPRRAYRQHLKSASASNAQILYSLQHLSLHSERIKSRFF